MERWAKAFAAHENTLPFIPLTKPEVRARKHKEGSVWSQRGMKKTLEEFAAVRRPLLMVPDSLCQLELRDDERFQVMDARGELVGVRMMCPTSKNTYTASEAWNNQCQRKSSEPGANDGRGSVGARTGVVYIRPQPGLRHLSRFLQHRSVQRTDMA